MDKGLQTVIFLFRHGQTDRYYFPVKAIDSYRVLNDLGRRQMSKVGEYLKNFSPGAIYSSPLERCQQTAEIIKQKIDLKVPVKTDERLAEIYSPITYQMVGQKGIALLQEMVKDNHGKQVVVVSHQVAIARILKDLGVEKAEADYPCLMAEGYRLVFAENTFVSAEKLSPAQDVV